MKRRRIRTRWKALALGILALTCIVIAFNIWFLQNTNAILESLVRSRSDGNVRLQLTDSKFNYLKKSLVLHSAVFYSANDSGATTSYQFGVQKLELKLRSLWAFLVHRELLIDSINLHGPEVFVTRIGKSDKQNRADVSIPEEIDRIYNSILDALQVLQVKRFQIDDGKFHLINKMDATRPVTTISNIHFHINNLKIKADSTSSEKFLFSDNIVLGVTNQNIALPDGVHHISFKNLRISVRNKEVVLDSCWLRTDTAAGGNAFRIFFDVLKLTNLDFTALAKKNLIKADSVYVDNPDINFSLYLKRKPKRGKKLELDTLIRQFASDMELGYIGVQNAAVNIVANRGDTATTFSSQNNNFRMYGLHVNNDSAKPVQVDEFTMVLQQYETYSRDSSAVYRFDSLRFRNNRVRLSNFTIQSIASPAQTGVLKYSIPAFELTGLSWEALLFDRYISAGRALLVNPDITYSINAPRKKKGTSSLFKLLSGLNETIDLDVVEIQNGNLNIQLPGAKRLQLLHVDLVLASNRLLSSKTYTGMQQAIDALAFKNAVFHTANLRAELINLRYSDRLHADELRVTNTGKTMVARATGITLNDLVWNNDDKSVFVDGLGWRQAVVTIRAGGKKAAQKATNAVIQLHNLKSRNTTLTVHAKDKILKTTIGNIALADFEKAGNNLKLAGFAADGKKLDVAAPAFQIKGGPYRVVDNGSSVFHSVSFLKQSLHDTMRLLVPQTFLKAHIEDLLRGNLRFDNITLAAPLFAVSADSVKKETAQKSEKQPPLPRLAIDRLVIENPVVRFVKRDTAGTTVTWSEEGSKSPNNKWTFSNIHTDPASAAITVQEASLAGNKALFTRNGKPMGIDSGRVQTTFTDMRLSTKNGLQWEANLQQALFQNPISPALKRESGFGVDEIRLQNVHLSSGNFKNVYRLLQANPAMRLQLLNGSYRNETARLQWKELAYSQKNGVLSVDSFSYRPALSRDSFIAKAPGQTDYMHAVLKNITVEGIDLTALERDSTFKAQTVVVSGSNLDIYRDKRKPFLSGKWKPLPAIALQALPVKLSVDTVALKDMHVSYSEMNAKTVQEGTVTVNRINAQLFPVRNINIGATDSLSLRAEGYLMNSAWLRLRLRESYTDSLGTFVMTLRMKPTDLSVLNPALMPMASVKLISGELDTVSLRAIGNDYFSVGEMKMYYKDLKIQYLKRGSETKKTFLTRLITFAANSLVLKKGNNSRTGAVYFLRNRDRGIFNFLIKTALSGMASSVGAKKNKKYLRQYKRQQKLHKLPPNDFG